MIEPVAKVAEPVAKIAEPVAKVVSPVVDRSCRRSRRLLAGGRERGSAGDAGPDSVVDAVVPPVAQFLQPVVESVVPPVTQVLTPVVDAVVPPVAQVLQPVVDAVRRSTQVLQRSSTGGPR